MTLKLQRLESTKKLSSLMSEYYHRVSAAATDRLRPVAWCTSVGPAELLYSMGFEVFFPENHAAMIGVSKQADRHIRTAVAEGYSPDICAYMTSDIGAFLDNVTPLQKFGIPEVPPPDVLVYNTNQCCEVQFWFDYYASRFQVPSIGIKTPHNVELIDDSLIQYLVSQYKALIPVLEKVSGNSFDQTRFSDTVALSRDACVLWRKCLNIAQHSPAPWTFFDATVHMAPIVVMRGLKSTVTYYGDLLEELQARVARNISAIGHETFRVYWEGMPIWGRLRAMAELFATLGLSVVASTYCNSWVFDELDPDRPFYSSAREYTRLFIVRADSVKEKMLLDITRSFNVQGIIYHYAKTCPRNSNNLHGLQSRLFEVNRIPYLEIDGDMNDLRCFSEEQTRFAIETFRDQLAMVK